MMVVTANAHWLQSQSGDQRGGDAAEYHVERSSIAGRDLGAQPLTLVAGGLNRAMVYVTA